MTLHLQYYRLECYKNHGKREIPEAITTTF